MGRRSQNGPTFTKAPSKPKRLSDEQRAVSPVRQAAAFEEKKHQAAKSRRFNELLHTMTGAFQELGGFLRRRTSLPTTSPRPDSRNAAGGGLVAAYLPQPVNDAVARKGSLSFEPIGAGRRLTYEALRSPIPRFVLREPRSPQAGFSLWTNGSRRRVQSLGANTGQFQ
jgi:hypothetical protein